MTTSQDKGVRRKLCSVFSTSNGEDPAGSATWWRRCLVVEVPEPWASDVIESRAFPAEVSAELARAAEAGLQVRLQCVTPDAEYSREGETGVMFFSRSDGPFSSYAKVEYRVPTAELGPLVAALLTRPEDLGQFAGYRQDTGHLRDILVCTHGSQDTCCGSIGYPVYDALRHRYARMPGANLRVWRVSHLGGHRFAPNVLDMPEGRNWVRIGEDQLDAFVHRNGAASDLRGQYRGWVGMESPYEQLAESEALMHEGWGWTERRVDSRLVDLDEAVGRAVVRLEFSVGTNGDMGAYVARIERTGSAPRADCISGAPGGDVPQYAVTELTAAG